MEKKFGSIYQDQNFYLNAIGAYYSSWVVLQG